MQNTSDILILFTSTLDELDMRSAKTHLMEVGRSVIVHQKEGHDRLLVVKFDPGEVKPSALLGAVTGAGFEAKMAGG